MVFPEDHKRVIRGGNVNESEVLLRAAIRAWIVEHPEDAEPVEAYSLARNRFAAMAERAWCDMHPGQLDGIDVPDVVPGAHVMYYAFDAYGHTLYLGITSDFPRRMREHERSSKWWKFASRIGVDAFATRAEIESNENDALFCAPPPFNLAVPTT